MLGELRILGHLVVSGKSLTVTIDAKMPAIEILTHGDATGEAEEIARAKAEDCFEPPLQIVEDSADEYYSTIRFGSEPALVINLLRSALNIVQSNLKIVMVVGERKVGKTTFCQYVATQFNPSEVYLLDADAGQPLNTPPAFLTLKRFQANHASNSTVWRGGSIGSDTLAMKFVGDYSPELYGSLFEEAVKWLHGFALLKHLKGVLLVNTGGFVRGTGLTILESMIASIKPHAIVEISQSGNNVVRNLSNPRQFNHISAKGDYVNSKISVLHLSALTSAPLRSIFITAREDRAAGMLLYFEEQCSRASLPWDDITLVVLEDDRKTVINKEELSAEEAALMLVGSVVAVELINESEVPALVEDFDIEEKRLVIRIQPEYRCQVPEKRVRLLKSPLVALETPTFEYEAEWRREAEEEGHLGKRLFWSGPMLGVGAKVLRRKVSNRKK